MSRYISDKKKKLVVKRAENRCEYCLIHEDDTFFSCQIDHIISVKHGGDNENSNLAYSCIYCNRNKGSDLGSVILPNKTLIRFYNPRLDNWEAHFLIEGAIIKGKTNIGKVTINIFNLNSAERLLERSELQTLKRYPVQ